MKVSVIGSGYVGTTTAALLAAAGHSVVAVDIDEKKVTEINNGKAPFYEYGLDALIEYCVKNGNLTASTSTDSISEADVIFSCVGTPDNPDGSPNLRFIDTVAETVAKLAREKAIFVQKSTVPVGTGERLIEAMPNIVYASNPEFLREGTALKDSLLYDRIVIGCDNNEAAKKIESLFKDIEKVDRDIIATAKLDISDDEITQSKRETIFTNINSAELIKVTANAFLALKISFANTVAKLADRSGADVKEVMDGVGSDSRIGKAFFNAGRGYGGGCFPKDVSGLISVAIDHGVDFNIMTAATDLNSSMPGYIVNKATEHTPLRDKRVAVLGLAFKAGTSDSRKSPAVEIANLLVRLGAEVHAYDPKATEEAKEDLNDAVITHDSIDSVLKNAEAMFVATEWPEFRELEASVLKEQMSGTLVVDAMNCLDKQAIEASGLTYIGVGR